jgi:hypothetical protein
MFWYAAGDVAMSRWLDWTRAFSVATAELILVGLTIFATLPRSATASEESDRSGEHATRSFALWVVAATMLSPTAWIHYLVLLILPLMLIAAAGWNGMASPRTLWLMAASYAVISLSMALSGSAHSALTDRPHLKAALEECATLSLLLAYASTWCFATDTVRCNRESNVASYPHQVMR